MSPVAARRLATAPPGWAELHQRDPNATPAHRPELWAAFAEAMPGLRAWFLAVFEGAALIGGAPVLIERRAGFHWIHSLPWLLPGAPLAVEGAHAAVDASVGLELAAMQKELHAVGGEWALYRPHGPTVEVSSLSMPGGVTRVLETSIVDLAGGLEAAQRRLDRKTRQAIARARARGLVFAEEPQALIEAYALHLRQSRTWPGHHALPIELARRLLSGTAAYGLGGPPARLFTVRDGRGLLSAVLALDHPNETFLWWSGTHPDGRARSAFPVLMWSVIEWASGAGRARVNLGASAGLEGVSLFKDAMGASLIRYPVRWLDSRHARGPGRLVGAIQERVRRGRTRGIEA